MLPYNLNLNPFPSSPTPTTEGVKVFGGKRHVDALNSIKNCVDEVYLKVNNPSKKEDLFKIVTVIQDVGSGKTHLTLHLRTLPDILDKAIISYIDLAQIHPRDIDNFFHAIITGFGKEYYESVKTRFLEYLKDSTVKNSRIVKKIVKYTFFDTINGNSLEEKIEQLKEKKTKLSYDHLPDLLSDSFSKIEIKLITEIIKTGTLNYSDLKTFENLTLVLNTIASINYKLFKKLTIYQIDEFDTNLQSLDYIKGLINSHISNSVLMLITTPSYYADISKINASLYDRLERANYKIDLAGSNSFDEINDIVIAYVQYFNNNLSEQEKLDLTSKIKIIYDEFPDFRNIRSILNVLYHAFEISLKKESPIIDEYSIEETIKNVYPGLRLRGSIMGISISDFINMRKISVDKNIVESNVKEAIKNLINYFDELGTVKKFEEVRKEGDFLDAIYNDQMGKKIGVAIAVDSDKNKNYDKIINSTKKKSIVDKLVILTTNITSMNKNGTTLVTVDRWKLADLLYFSKKYDNKEIKLEDPQRALLLAKSIQIC